MSRAAARHSLPIFRQGNAVLIDLETRDERARIQFANQGPEAPLFDPNEGVTVNITFGPTFVVVALGLPTQRLDTGLYRVVYQLVMDCAIGLYNLEAIAMHGRKSQRSQIYGAFKVVE